MTNLLTNQGKIYPAILGFFLGLIAPWFILGYWTRWLFFPEFGKILFLILTSAISVLFLVFSSLTLWGMISNPLYRKKSLVTLLLIVGLCTLGSLLFRADLPLALSNPFKVHEISIEKIPMAGSDDQNKISFDFSSAYGKTIFFPSLEWSGGWTSSGETISNSSNDGKPLNYRFLENRLTDSFSIRLHKSPSSGQAHLITPDREITLDFSSETNETETILIDLEGIQKPSRIFMLVEFFLQILILTILITFTLLSMPAVYRGVTDLSFRAVNWFSSLFLSKILQIKISRLLFILVFIGVILFLIDPAIFLFAINCVLLCLFSIFLTSIFNLKNVIAYIIAFYVLAYSDLVLIIEILGGLAYLNPLGITLLQIIFSGAAWQLWLRWKKPDLVGPFRLFFSGDQPKMIMDVIRENKEIALLMLSVLVSHAITFIKILLVPQNYDDILTAYLSRVGYWIQNQSLHPWNTSTYNLSQIVYPLNGQVPLVWSASLLKSSALIGFLQWFSLPIGILAIYGISRQFGLARWQSWLGALLFALFPNVIMQSSSALTDLLIACLFVSMVYLFICGLQGEDRSLMTLSAISLGLMIGVKQTAIFLLPGLAVLLLFIHLDLKKRSLKSLMNWCLAAIISVFLLGAYVYLMNYVNFGNFGGSAEIVEKNFSQLDFLTIPGKVLRLAGSNLYQLMISALFDNFFVEALHPYFVDFYSLIPTSSPIHNYFPMDRYLQGIAWIGPIGFFLSFAALFKLLQKAIKEKKWVYWGIFALIIPFTASFLILKSNVVAMSRYLLLIVVMLMPFIPFVLKNRMVRQWVIVLSIILAGITLLDEGFKPLRGPNAIWNLTCAEKQTMRFPELRPLFNNIAMNVPEDATMGILLPSKFPQALLFSPDFSRRIIQIEPTPDEIQLIELKNDGIEFLLVEKKLITDGLRLPSELKELFNTREAPILFAVP